MAFLHCFLLWTVLAAKFGCDHWSIQILAIYSFQAWAHQYFKFQSSFALQLKYGQTSSSCQWTACRFRSATLHRIQLRTCGFVLVIFTRRLRLMSDKKIESRDECCFGKEQPLAKSIVVIVVTLGSDTEWLDSWTEMLLSQYQKKGNTDSYTFKRRQWTLNSSNCHRFKKIEFMLHICQG